MTNRIPTYLAECCREWVAPLGFRGARCGLCGERPEFVKHLPENQWVTTPPPIREHRP